MKQILTVLFAIVIFSCNQDSRTQNILKIEGNNDTCYTLTDSVKRQVDIIENTLEDTILLGFGVVPPKYIGKFNYLGVDGKTDALIYPQTPTELMPKIATICVNLYEKRRAKGFVVLKFKD